MNTEVREDYPYLSSEDLEFASLYARAYPPIGRPRERKSSCSMKPSPRKSPRS